MGIDAKVARFFAQHKSDVTKPVEIGEVTNKRLRWMVHKRIPVVMVATYLETMDKLYDVLFFLPIYC